MFWESDLVGTDIYSVIDRDPPPSLEEVLLEEGIIQEVRSRDSRIVEFFARDAHIVSLIDYLTLEDADTTGNTNSYKFPFVSSEILASGIDGISSKLGEFMNIGRLFSVFKRTSINQIMCNFTIKVMLSLLSCFPGKVYDYICENQDEILKLLFNHMENSSVVEFIVKLFSPDMGEYQKPFIKILRNQKFIERIYDLISPNTPAMELIRLNVLFYDLVRIARVKSMQIPEDKQWLLRQLIEDAQTNDNLDKLITNMFAVDGYTNEARFDAISAGCNILICLFDLSRVGDFNGDEFVEAGNINLCFNLTISTDFKLLSTHVPKFMDFLKEFTIAGKKNPSVTSASLLVIRFLSACALHNVIHLNKALTQSGFFQFAMDCFAIFPNFNILHDVVIHLLSSVLQGHFYCYVSNSDIEEGENSSVFDPDSDNDSILSENAYLQFYLIDEVNITRRLLSLMKENQNSIFGYDGHLLSLMEQLSLFTSDIICPVLDLSNICKEHGPEGELLKDFGVEKCDICHRARWDMYMDTRIEEYKKTNETSADLHGFDLNLYGDQLDVYYAIQNMSTMSPAIMKKKVESIKKEVDKGYDAMNDAKNKLNVKIPANFLPRNENRRKSIPINTEKGCKEEKLLRVASLCSSKTKYLQSHDDTSSSVCEEVEIIEKESKSEDELDQDSDGKPLNKNFKEACFNPFITKELFKSLNSDFGGEKKTLIYSMLRTKASSHGQIYMGEEFVQAQPKPDGDTVEESAECLKVNIKAHTMSVNSADSDLAAASFDNGDDIFKDGSSDSVFNCDIVPAQIISDDDVQTLDPSVNTNTSSEQNEFTNNSNSS